MASASRHPQNQQSDKAPETGGLSHGTAKVSADLDGAQSAPSRPRQLFAQLSEAFDQQSPQDDRRRWPPRRTLAFIVLTCGTFWLLAAAVVFSLAF